MRTRSDNHWTPAALGALLLIGLPLIGAAVVGAPVAQYLEFPPLTRYVEHAGFSWVAFLIMSAGILLVVLPFERRVFASRRHQAPAAPVGRFPWWGWGGVAWTAVVWAVAWIPVEGLEGLRRFTFGPLWFGYIVVVNAWTYARTGQSMLTHRPALLLRLAALSAVFWWYFEYLNRFVQNWYYVGIEDLGPVAYFIYATVPFATVLPAVLGTYELLRSAPRIGAGLESFLPIAPRGRVFPAIALLVSALGLAGIAIWPSRLYPLLWVAPLLTVVSLQALLGQRTVFTPVASGRWRDLYLLAAAALICGFFWEFWNVASSAKWIYTIPYVGRFRLFEMPLLGYAGYLPFGLECAVIARFVGWRPVAPETSDP